MTFGYVCTQCFIWKQFKTIGINSLLHHQSNSMLVISTFFRICHNIEANIILALLILYEWACCHILHTGLVHYFITLYSACVVIQMLQKPNDNIIISFIGELKDQQFVMVLDQYFILYTDLVFCLCCNSNTYTYIYMYIYIAL